MRSFLSILKLCRVEYAGFGYVALLGGLAERGLDLPLAQIFALLGANMLFGMWTFAHNDLCDLEVDRRAAALDERVLVRGDLSPGAAKLLIAVLIGAMLVISWRWLGIEATVGFAAASLLAMAYDLVSKRLLGSDLLFGGSAACLAIAGAFAGNGAFALSPLAVVVVIVIFLEHLFFNAIEGGLKDVVSDRDAGAVTFAQRYVRVEGDSISIQPAFRNLGLLLKASAVFVATVPLIRGGSSEWGPLLALVVVGATAFAFSVRLLSRRRYDWIAIAKDLMPIEMASRLFLPILLTDRIGIGGVILFLCLPAGWYIGFAKLVHARGMSLPKRF